MKPNRRMVKSSLLLTLLACLVSNTVMAGGAEEPRATRNVPPAVKTRAQNLTELLDLANRRGHTRVIVKLKTPATPEASLRPAQVTEQRHGLAVMQVNVLEQLRGQSAVREDSVKRFAITPAFAMEASADNIARLLENPDVEEVVEDAMSFPALYESSPLIGATSAWAAGYTGSGQVVAILDTGVAKTHPFLTGKVVSEACYSTTASGSGWTTTSLCPGGAASSTASNSGLNCDTTAWGSGCSHGTHVAGIAAGQDGSSSGGTMSGVARAANVIAVQVFSGVTETGLPNDVAAFDSDLVLALERIYALRSTYNIAAVNMSLGGGQYAATCDGSSLKPVVDNLRTAGIATVIASGNNGWAGYTGAPGCISTAITVGSSTKTNQKASYSNMASWVDLFGPGSSICSSIAGVASTCGTGYAAGNGTSMAAPQVAGAWAVMKSKKPAATVSEIEQALESTGVPITTTLGNWPRIDLVPALALLNPGGGTGTVIGLAAQGKVDIDNEQLFGGFTVSGDSRRVLIRGLGPTLVQYGTPGIADPQIRLTANGSNTTLFSNDNWQQAGNAAEIQSLGFQPSNASESALLITLPPGTYNIFMNPATGGTGIGLLEVYPK